MMDEEDVAQNSNLFQGEFGDVAFYLELCVATRFQAVCDHRSWSTYVIAE